MNWYVPELDCEVPYSEIEKKAENGDFHKWGYVPDPFEFHSNGYDSVVEKLKSYTAEEYNKQDDAGKEKMVDEVLAIYRDINLFPIQYYSEMGMTNEVEKCMNFNAKFDGDTISTGAGIGTGLCRFLFPNIFDTPSKHDLDKKDAETMFAKFHNDTYLRRAIKFCFSYKNGSPVPTSVEGGLRLVGSAPSNFRPMNAKAVYERFCPKGGIIYDFCCVDDETEFFNGKEWKSLAEYKEGDKVLQYNEDGTAELVEPIEYIHYQSNAPFYEQNSSYLSSCQTGNHDVVYIEEGTIKKVKQDKILGKSLGGIPISYKYSGDKHLGRGEVVELIDKAEYSSTNSEYPYELATLSLDTKEVLLQLLIDEGIIYRSPLDGILMYKAKNKMNAKNIASMVSSIGYQANYVSDYCVDISTGLKGRYNGEYTEVFKRDKYCFVVPSHMLVLKRNGKCYITGNCGFGGRMLGALSSKNNYRYVGTDPNTETQYHLHELAEAIETATGREDSYELHCCGSEVFRGKPNSIDFAFSSPPYFDLEVYSDEPTQCFNKFPKLEDWLEGYVRETIKNIYYMLKPGRYYAVNIADFKVGGGTVIAYVDEWIRISTEEGMPLFDTVYLGVTARAGSKEQAAGELKKENILIFKKPM